MTSDQRECSECFGDGPLHPDGICNNCKTFSEPEKFKREARGDFALTAPTYDGPLETYVCVGCGADKFTVGRKAYTTAIKCDKCGWERTIHDG